MGEMKGVKGHFNELASRYDSYKDRNSYYSKGLEELVVKLAGQTGRGSVLDLGCGTGRLLKRIQPFLGVGVDVSGEMIRIAAEESLPTLRFLEADVLSFFPDQGFDLVVCCDVLEHVSDYSELIWSISRYPGHPMVIMTWPNPRWFPLMRLLERLRLKMPEGPLYPSRLEQVSRQAEKCGLAVLGKGFRMLVPAGLLGLGELMNSLHCKGFLQSWGLVQYLVLEKR